ncbi:MAG: glycogen synthase GlgA [Candidatus Binatia bacterium]
MRIAFVSSEVRPFSQTGGLADVSEALPAALAALGCDVTVISPLYRNAAEALARLDEPLDTIEGPPVPTAGAPQPLRYRTLKRAGCRLVFVEHAGFYDRPNLYVDSSGADYADNVARFAFLCRAALAYHGARPPDMFHCNDWQTALLPVYLRAAGRTDTRSLMTIHNLGYQGLSPATDLAAAQLDASWFHIDGLEFYGRLNLLKGGLLYADAITAVSPSYAEEIQTPLAGWGLDGVLRAQRHKLRGILNGIDVARWNPAEDPHIAKRYSADDLAGKAACKRALQRRSGLPLERNAFLMGAISRFDAQKGLPLICDAFPIVAPLGAQLVVLGSGDPAIAARVRTLAAAYPGQVSATIGFDDAYAHQIEAGADAFLMPSAYEPCGLNQMYSQRYGTVPIVHATGGLKDTVTDYSPERLAAGQASGFRFDVFDAAHVAAAMLRAWRVYRETPRSWRRLMVDIMRLDNSWARSARAYLALYQTLAPPARPARQRRAATPPAGRARG